MWERSSTLPIAFKDREGDFLVTMLGLAWHQFSCSIRMIGVA